MARSDAATVAEYLAGMPPEREEEVRRVVDVVRANLPAGYEEAMAWGMATWQVPLSTYPDTYNKQPLVLAALANQKNHLSLYLNSVQAIPGLRALLDESGRRLSMGKSCITFRRAEELPLEAIGEVLRRSDVETYVAATRAARG